MTQDTWQYQGRQQHGQWGHGTAPHADKQPDPRPLIRGPRRENPPAPAGIAARAAYAAYGVAVHLPLSRMDVYEARLRGGMLADFQKAMTAFPDTAHLSDEAYRDRVLDDMLTLTETHQLRVAGLVIHTARTLDDLAPATTALANVVKSAGMSFTGKALDAAAKASSSASDTRVQTVADTGQSPTPVQEAARPYGVGTRVILPNGETVPPGCTTDCLMSPVADLSPVAAAGREIGATYRELLQDPDPEVSAGAISFLASRLLFHLGHGGVFDYQRLGSYITGFTSFPQYRDVSNFNVGLLCQQAGLSLDETLTISGWFAKFLSSNADPNERYNLDRRTARFMRLGFSTGELGIFKK